MEILDTSVSTAVLTLESHIEVGRTNSNDYRRTLIPGCAEKLVLYLRFQVNLGIFFYGLKKNTRMCKRVMLYWKDFSIPIFENSCLELNLGINYAFYHYSIL